jgi:hypothetical protein
VRRPRRWRAAAPLPTAGSSPGSSQLVEVEAPLRFLTNLRAWALRLLGDLRFPNVAGKETPQPGRAPECGGDSSLCKIEVIRSARWTQIGGPTRGDSGQQAAAGPALFATRAACACCCYKTAVRASGPQPGFGFGANCQERGWRPGLGALQAFEGHAWHTPAAHARCEMQASGPQTLGC